MFLDIRDLSHDFQNFPGRSRTIITLLTMYQVDFSQSRNIRKFIFENASSFKSKHVLKAMLFLESNEAFEHANVLKKMIE